jgi:putative SOS response-associated peptidase YedK
MVSCGPVPEYQRPMCGRFAITLPPDAMAQLFAAVPANDLPPVPNYNVCPTNSVHAVVSDEGSRRLVAMRWGFIPHWYKTPSDGPLLINARADTIAEKPAFRAAVRERRCLIPADGFYEWTKDEAGRPPAVVLPPRGRRAHRLRGLWQDWEREGERLTTCAIVTTEAEGSLTQVHHRVPVILRPEDWRCGWGRPGRARPS